MEFPNSINPGIIWDSGIPLNKGYFFAKFDKMGIKLI